MVYSKNINKKFRPKFFDDFLGEILDKVFQKVPHRFLEKIWSQKIAWIFIYQTKK